jgi:exonuclease 3'-5' domain-containing protein 1
MTNLDDHAPGDDGIDMVDTESAVSSMLDGLEGLPTNPPSLYCDLEGVNLSRYGSISIFQLHVLPRNRTYLIDIYTLQNKAFSTPSKSGRTLKDVLECAATPKVFFDVRNDSDALHSHFGIALAGVQDLQLMELAARSSSYSRRVVNGLARCIERDAPLSAAERRAWAAVKEAGLRLFAPERGGSYAVFNARPLPPAIRRYCAQDVLVLPRLWALYDRRMGAAWRARVLQASRERVAMSQAATYNPWGSDRALAPANW